MMNVEAEWLRHVEEMRMVLLVVGFFPKKIPFFFIWMERRSWT